MTGLNKAPSKSARNRRDLRTVLVALALLAVCGGLWLWMSSDAGARRDKVLASIPAFPEKGQDDKPRRAMAPNVPPRPPAARPKPPPTQQAPRVDPITSFVLAPSPNVALVHVNALFHTPLFAKIKECLPTRWNEMTDRMQKLGVDVERDVDRVAMTGDGMAMSGFFEGKPVAESIAAQWQGAQQREYRGAQIFTNQGGAVAQAGNLVLFGPRDNIEKLIDRALDPPESKMDPQDIYGDLFVRSDLTTVKERAAASGGTETRDAMQAILDGLNGMTVRANVWDSVALSLEGTPKDGQSVRDLARMARGAISLAREQVDPNDVELATLAELAKVESSKTALNIDLALPAADLFDRLHFPCPGKQKP